jgi:CRISPR-associated endonuclease Cas3-HD
MTTDKVKYAHSLPGRPIEEWEKLSDHLEAVAARAAGFAAVFGWAEMARAAGLLHDIGKCSNEFLAYIERSAAGEGGLRSPDHSTAGARVAEVTYRSHVGRCLSHIVAGHHAGLAARLRPHFLDRLPETKCSVGDREFGSRREPPPFEVDEKLLPGLRALAHAVDEPDDFLFALKH